MRPSFKSVGLNLNGVPTDALGNPVLSAATVKPEDVHHFEVGLKTEPFPGATANVTVFNTGIKDFQTQVVNAQVGVLRGYLANAEKVRVRGAEFDGSARLSRQALDPWSARLHRRHLPFVPRRSASARGHRRPAGQGHLGLRAARHLQVGALSRRRVRATREPLRPGRRVLRCARRQLSLRVFVERHSLAVSGGRRLRVVNARVGFRWPTAGRCLLWSRNLLDEEYFELLTAPPGNSGLYVGLPGDPRTAGVTLRMSFRSGK